LNTCFSFFSLFFSASGGEGKTFVTRWYAAAMGYIRVESLFLFEDMTARDLFNRRSTNTLGESVWLPTPLTNALRYGRLCVLDGLHRLSSGTISALVRLLQDREVTLNDGTRYISPIRYQYLLQTMSTEYLTQQNIFVVHPSFRVVGLAVPRERRTRRWLTNEVMQMFHFFVMPHNSNVNLRPFVQSSAPACPADIVDKLVGVRRDLFRAAKDKGSPLWVGSDEVAQTQYKNIRTVEDTYVLPNTANTTSQSGEEDEESLIIEEEEEELPAGAQATVLSLRQILRVAKRAGAAPPGTNLDSDVGATLEAALMTEFMPRAERSA